MTVVISHNDTDGVVSLAVFLKYSTIRPKVYFTSVGNLLKTVCFSITSDKLLKNLYVFDLSPNIRAVRAASTYDEVVWIDHHIFEKFEPPKNVKLVVEEDAPSAAQVVSDYFGLERDELIDMANQVDQNKIESDDARFLRDLIDSIKWKYSRSIMVNKLRSIAKILAMDDFKKLRMNENLVNLVNEYRKRNKELMEEIKKKIEAFNINNKKIAIIETTFGYPINLVLEVLKEHEMYPFDLVASLSHRLNENKIISRIELRTQTDKDIIDIALQFGGGGHRKACGATLNRFISSKELVDIITSFIENKKI